MNADLTINTPWKVLLKYTLPLFGGAVFQQLYTLADTIIAGRFAGQTALTAIGASNAIVNILMAFALGANAGCAVLAARYFGKKDNSNVKSTIYTALIAFSVFSAVLMVAGVFTCRLTLEALKTPQEAMDESVTYLNIYYYGLPFLMLYNLGTGIFSALGDSKTPFLFLVFSSVTNIVLDYFMVQPWGVAGVAWATFIAQGAACVFTLFFVFRRARMLQVAPEEKIRPFSWGLLKMLVLLSLPVILQNSFVSVGNLFIQVRCGAGRARHHLGLYGGLQSRHVRGDLSVRVRKRTDQLFFAELRGAEVPENQERLLRFPGDFHGACGGICARVCLVCAAANRLVHVAGRGFRSCFGVGNFVSDDGRSVLSDRQHQNQCGCRCPRLQRKCRLYRKYLFRSCFPGRAGLCADFVSRVRRGRLGLGNRLGTGDDYRA